jgi:hypothetical protein
MEGERDLYLRNVMDARDQADLEFVLRMFREPLFSRVWIIQDLGVARDVTFLYGDFEIEWIDLLFFVNCMVGSQDLYQLEHFTDYEKIYSAFSSFRPSLQENKELPDFLDVLLMAQNYGALDLRDHVFALLGQPSAYNEGSPIIKADYTKPVSHILTQVTLQLLLQSKSLRPLSAAHHDRLYLNKNFPSWVPALHQASLVAPFGIDKRFYYTADSAVADTQVFRCSSDGMLTVLGLVFDTLSSGSSTTFPDGVAATEPRIMQTFREAFALSQSKVQVAYEAAKRLEVFGLTMTAGLLEYTAAEDDIAHHRANFSAYLIKVLDMQRNTRQKLALPRDQMLVATIRNEALTATSTIS